MRPRRRPDIYPGWWRRRPILALCVVALAVAWVASRSVVGPAMRATRATRATRARPDEDRRRYDQREATVVRVVDGDTIDVDIPDRNRSTTRIRLRGVDTPEVAGSPRGAMYFGRQATAFTRAEVDGRRVRLVLEPERPCRDRYGRLLAYVYRADTGAMLNERLLETGHGYADTRFSHVYKSRFQELERRARRAKAGLWAHVTPEQYPPWRRGADR